jgi:CBS domain-containing protein
VELAESTPVANILTAGISGPAAKGAASVRRWHKEQGSHYSPREKELAKHLVFQFELRPATLSQRRRHSKNIDLRHIDCVLALKTRIPVMKVSDILQIKGSKVKTVSPDTSARELSVRLHAEQIGAMIVTGDGRTIDGIVSERDLAYAIAAHGIDLPALPVSRLMTKAVVVCSPDDTINHVMKLMTQLRVRHLPVKEGDQLIGIVSIGDVLKHRLDELELEANVMRDYAVAARH